MTTIKTAPFALDPTLPWLFSDPKMQEPAAFHGMQTIELSAEGYEPMALYFPGGTTLAMRRVTSLDQLIEGAAYWHVLGHYEENLKKVVNHYRFGRYAGPAYPESKSTLPRWKRGEAHLTLEADTLDCSCPMREYMLHEDGTTTAFVNVGRGSFSQTSHSLYQITHYVNLPTPLLAGLGAEAVKQSGLTLRQATWLKQEQELQRNSFELTMKMQGGLNLPDYRVVLPFDQLRDFLSAQESCPQITPGQARKCKSGTLAITVRHSNTGREYCLTEHYKLADAAILIDWMRHHSDLQNTTLNAAISRQTIGHIAEAFQAQQQIARQAQAAQASGLALTQQNDCAGVKELAHAA